MKKLRIFAALLCMICAIGIFASCGEKLETPTGVVVTEENVITWDAVEDTYRYLIQFKDVDSGETKELKTKDSAISVSEFELEEGWYELRIKALSGGEEENNSDWSQVLQYYKVYESGCTFTLVNNVEYHVTGSTNAKGDVRIESTYKGKPVTRIAEAAFKLNARITSVTFGDYVEAIDKNAFYNCSQLKSVTFPESLKTIGEAAFQSCRELTSVEFHDQMVSVDKSAFSYCRKLQTLNLGTSIRAINENAFYGCSELKEINIPDSVEFIGEKAFSNCTAVQSVYIGKGVVEINKRTFYENTELANITFAEGIQLKTIDDLAFGYATKVSKVVVPDGVEYLGDNAFQGCSELLNISIPNTLTHIGAYAFGGTKYYKALVDNPANKLYYLGDWLIGAQTDEDESDDVDESFKGTIEIITADTFKEGIVGIADMVLYRCPNLYSVVFPDSLKYIGDYAFYQCPKLNLVTSHSVKTIGAYAFAENGNISQLTLGSKLETIGAYAFFKCISLENNATNPIVPESVTKIGTYAFYGSGLWKKPSEDGVIYAGRWIVGCTGDVQTVDVQPGTVGISDYAFYLAGLESISGLTSSVKYIGRGAFFGCTKLGTLALCDEMEEIDEYAFYACTNLLEITFPENLEKIGRSAFYGCTILSHVDFSALLHLEEIGPYAFMNCINLTEIDFGYTLETIGDYAFYKCYSIESVELPDTVKTIGNYAFYGNYFAYENESGELIQKGLKHISFDRDPFDKYDSQLTTIGDYAFTSSLLLEEIVLPDSLISIGTSAFYNCVAVQSVQLGESLQTIGAYAFFGINKPTELQLPETLKQVGMYAFKGWEGLNSIVIPDNVEFINEHALYGCKNATIYTEASFDEIAWSLRWNSSYRPVVFGVTLSEDNSYVASLTIAEDTFANVRADSIISAPTRDGYQFKGWATTENGAVAYTANEIANLPVGTTLYAIWETTQNQ